MSVRAPYLTPGRLAATTAALALLLLASIVGAVLVGPVPASLWRALGQDGTSSADYTILFRTRLPRVLLGAVVGGSLGAAGAALQALLRNPLACPHLLGISGGAAVAGVLALLAGADALGVPGASERLVGDVAGRLDAVRTRVAELAPRRMLVVIKHNPLIAVGGDNLQDELVTLAGDVNVAADAEAT